LPSSSTPPTQVGLPDHGPSQTPVLSIRDFRESSSEGWTRRVIVITAIIVPFLTILALGVLCYAVRQRRRLRRSLEVERGTLFSNATRSHGSDPAPHAAVRPIIVRWHQPASLTVHPTARPTSHLTNTAEMPLENIISHEPLEQETLAALNRTSSASSSMFTRLKGAFRHASTTPTNFEPRPTSWLHGWLDSRPALPVALTRADSVQSGRLDTATIGQAI